MMLTRQEIADAVSTTLGDHVDDYDMDAVTAEIIATYGAVSSLDDIPTDEYWALIERHDLAAGV